MNGSPTSVPPATERCPASKHAETRANAMRGLLLEGELLRVLDRFAQLGIVAAILKGVPQQRAIHGHLGARRLCDNDLLVHRRDVVRAAQALRSLGYGSRSEWQLSDALDNVSEYCLSLERNGTVVPVDLHWEVIPARLFPIGEEEIWAQMRRTDLRGRQAWTPSFSLGVLIACDQVLTHIHRSPVRIPELASWWNRATEHEREAAHCFADRVGCPELLNLPLRIAWCLGHLRDEPRASATTRVQARCFVSRLKRNRPVDGLLMAWGRLAPMGPRRATVYVWSRFFVSDRELFQTPGAASRWSRTLGPRVGRVANAILPRR